MSITRLDIRMKIAGNLVGRAGLRRGPPAAAPGTGPRGKIHCPGGFFGLYFSGNSAMGNKRSHHGRGTALAENAGAEGFQIKGRLWLEKEGEPYLSWGRVVLLERIREHHSIAAAARSLDMAYSHAWALVAALNRLAGQDLVGRSFGGRGGGRAWVTAAGEEAISRFWRLVADFRDWLASRQF